MVGVAAEAVGAGTMAADEMAIGIGIGIGIGKGTLDGPVANPVQTPVERGPTETMIDIAVAVAATPQTAADRLLPQCACLPQET